MMTLKVGRSRAAMGERNRAGRKTKSDRMRLEFRNSCKSSYRVPADEAPKTRFLEERDENGSLLTWC